METYSILLLAPSPFGSSAYLLSLQSRDYHDDLRPSGCFVELRYLRTFSIEWPYPSADPTYTSDLVRLSRRFCLVDSVDFFRSTSRLSLDHSHVRTSTWGLLSLITRAYSVRLGILYSHRASCHLIVSSSCHPIPSRPPSRRFPPRRCPLPNAMR